MRPESIRIARRSLGWVVGIASCWYLVSGLIRGRQSIVELNLPLFGIAVAVGVAGRVPFLLAWLQISHSEGATNEQRRMLQRLWAFGWLARYLPGRVAWLVVRFRGLKKAGSSTSSAASRVSFDTIGNLATAAIAGLILMLAAVKPLLLLAVGGFLLSSYLASRSRSFRHLYRRFVPARIRMIVRGNTWSRSALGHYLVGNTAALGTTFFLLLSRGDDAFGSSTLLLAGINVLSGLIGTLVIFAPAGLGVRDALVGYLSSDILGPTASVTFALQLRVISIFADVLVSGGVLLLSLRPRQSLKTHQPNSMN